MFQSRNRETFDSNCSGAFLMRLYSFSFNLVIEKLLIPTNIALMGALCVYLSFNLVIEKLLIPTNPMYARSAIQSAYTRFNLVIEKLLIPTEKLPANKRAEFYVSIS